MRNMGKTLTVDLQVMRMTNQSNYFTKPKEVNFQDSGLFREAVSAKESHIGLQEGHQRVKVERVPVHSRESSSRLCQESTCETRCDAHACHVVVGKKKSIVVNYIKSQRHQEGKE